VLVEFPYFTVPPRAARVLAHLRDCGWVPVLAHPERYAGLEVTLALVEEWRAAGAYLQLNGPSLLGRYGPDAQRIATELLARGWIDYLSSDYHARGAPRVTEYRAALCAQRAELQADLLACENPARLLRGELPLPVPPAEWSGGG
jgi:protein-tyrosine phosphatase